MKLSVEWVIHINLLNDVSPPDGFAFDEYWESAKQFFLLKFFESCCFSFSWSLISMFAHKVMWTRKSEPHFSHSKAELVLLEKYLVQTGFWMRWWKYFPLEDFCFANHSSDILDETGDIHCFVHNAVEAHWHHCFHLNAYLNSNCKMDQRPTFPMLSEVIFHIIASVIRSRPSLPSEFQLPFFACTRPDLGDLTRHDNSAMNFFPKQGDNYVTIQCWIFFL